MKKIWKWILPIIVVAITLLMGYIANNKIVVGVPFFAMCVVVFSMIYFVVRKTYYPSSTKKTILIIGFILIGFIGSIVLIFNQVNGQGISYNRIDSYMAESLNDEDLYVYSEWSKGDYLIKSFISNDEDWGYYLFVNDNNTWVHENTYNLKNGADKNYIVTSEKSTSVPLWVVLVNNDDKYETIYSVVQSINHNGESVTERTEKIDLEPQYSMVVFENKENYQNYNIYFDLGNDDILAP